MRQCIAIVRRRKDEARAWYGGVSASVWGKGIVCLGEIETMRLGSSIADVASEKARIEAEASEKVRIDADVAAEIACIDADVVSEKARVEAENAELARVEADAA